MDFYINIFIWQNVLSFFIKTYLSHCQLIQIKPLIEKVDIIHTLLISLIPINSLFGLYYQSVNY